MTEKLLQYLWNFKIFSRFDFRDTEGNPIEILYSGVWNTNAGPDFLDARIRTGNIVLAGPVELHIRSSDWIFHNHSRDPNYKNIILHVVFQHDIEIDELIASRVPTLELKDYINGNILRTYEKLAAGERFIPCEAVFDAAKVPVCFHEGNILKKLEQKAVEFETSLNEHKNNFEAVLFHSLAYSFGLTVNAAVFRQIAESIDFSIINKIRQHRVQLEALLFGISGWLEDPQDEQMHIWKREFDFLKVKFSIPGIAVRPKFSRLRPPNFPTVRLSQLACLYHQHQNLFSKIIRIRNPEEMSDLFNKVKASEYWDDRFNFGKISKIRYPKTVSPEFTELVILNTVLPLKYTYQRYRHEEAPDEILQLYRSLAPEKNIIVDEWKKLGLRAETALESQSLIFHYKNACEEKNCLNCSIGYNLLKES